MLRLSSAALVTCLFLAACHGAPLRHDGAARPNVVIFLVDDLGWRDHGLSLPGAPAAHFRTPNLERLAARGVTFTQAYASAPVCTPTRTSLMTGQSPGQTHITYWTLNADEDTSRDHPRLSPPAWRLAGLDLSDETLPRRLRSAGYRTIHAGKAHFGAHGSPGSDPLKLGFDVNIAGHGSGAPSSYLGLHDFARHGRNDDPEKKPSIWDVPGLAAYHGEDVWLTDVLALEARAAVRDAVDEGLPFFLNFAPYAVHTPIMAHPGLVGAYDELHPREAAYASMVEAVDRALGTLVAELEGLGVLDDTLIVFTSDNGGLSALARGGAPNTHNAPLASGKGSAYEGGTRVPMVIAGPGIDRGTTCAIPVVTHDLFPTVLAVARAGPPNARVEGRDLGPLLAPGTEDRSELERRALFWHQPHQWGAAGPGIEPFTSVRAGDHKLIWFHDGGRCELYDLAEDPGETHDLTLAERQRARALALDMQAWIRRYDVQLSIDKATGAPLPGPVDAVERTLAGLPPRG